MVKRKYDIILMGATSFVGQITAWRMAEHYLAHEPALKWAWAGRSLGKLQQVVEDVQQRLGQPVKVDLLQAESLNGDSMTALAQQARVIATTVGPYDFYGEQLVKSCAENGTHYCDLTGEPHFIAEMQEKYAATAEKSGACIVHCCGFDSIPFDINAYLLQKQAQETFAEPCRVIHSRVERMEGTFSGGTMASIVNIFKRAKQDPGLRKKLLDPYLLAPGLKRVKQPFVGSTQFDDVTGKWMAPFVMAGINTKIVLRSAQLLPSLFPEDVVYEEGLVIGKSLRSRLTAHGLTLGIGALGLAASFSPSRWLLNKTVLPQPGEGPTEKQQQDGNYRVRQYGETASGKKIAVEVEGDMDPGYGSTAKILLQAATALALDLPEDQPGGFFTPAAVIGESLLTRLPKYAGVVFREV